MTVGDRIREARTKAGKTQEEVAKAVDTTKQAIYKYENNIVTNIPMDKLEAIARALGTTQAYLMGWEKPIEKKSTGLRSISRLESNDISPEDDEEISRFIDFLIEKKKTRAGKARVFLSEDQTAAGSFCFFFPNRWERLSITE